ncbi:MFS transporter [Rhodococcus opacus]|uniref:MFS transporter n=1 Tax=Rhodococcus opacus TaxID=37919 RepID=A0A2S8IU50_RHOOP|nr:MFS transporter [Rhodococcus opacus]PQP17882.1 MFS transporter [Rhodococcus opacus]
MLRSTRITVLLLFAAWAVDYIDRLVINLALPAIGTEFALDYGQRGLIVSAFFVAYALSQIPGGLLADRFGAVRIALAGLIAWSLFTGLTAIAWSFTALLAIRLLFGFAQGVFPAAAIKLLSERSVPEQRMTANGWMLSSNAFGSFAAAIIASILLPLWGWRPMFAVIAVLGVVVVVAIKRWMPAALPSDVSTLDPATAHRSSSSSGVGIVLRAPAMWCFALVFFGYDVIVWGIGSWTVSYLHEERGVSIGTAGLLSIAPTLVAAIAVIVGGRLSDRWKGRPSRIIVPAMIVSAALVIVLPHTESVTMFVVVGTVLSGISALCYMPAFAVPLRSLPASVSGAASSMILFGGMIAGIAAPLAFGAIVDAASWNTAFGALAVGPLIAIAAVLAAPQTTDHMLAAVRLDRTPDREETHEHSTVE